MGSSANAIKLSGWWDNNHGKIVIQFLENHHKYLYPDIERNLIIAA